MVGEDKSLKIKHRTMILELNKEFERYIPVEVLSQGTPYREEYLAKNLFGQKVVLTVYDMKVLPECFEDGRIQEFEVIPRLSNCAFPEYIEQGTYNSDNMSLCWMTSEYVGHTSLTDFILSDKGESGKEMLLQFYNLLLALKELYGLVGSTACHNNISTDNIIVSDSADGGPAWNLRGLNCISEKCCGKAKFDINVPSRFFLAPETLVGNYNIKTDIFSLGVVLAFAVQGQHPWVDIRSSDIPKKTLLKSFREKAPLLEMPDALKVIVGKAIAPKPSERFSSLEEFGAALAEYIGDDTLGKFGHGVSAPENLRSETPDHREVDSDVVDCVGRQTLPQPTANVKIERVKGNGFKDVAGMDQLKSKLIRNFVEILQNRELASQFNITPPNGILLWGPPGTGKTFISRKLAEESGLLFSLVKPSDLGNIYVHGSQSMIADLFVRSEELAARNNCGVLLVFDEFDSLVPKRGAQSDSNQANEVAEFLTRLNDCAERNVFVVATTNRIDAIDPAIIRKGRMDEVIYVGLPDRQARKELLEIELLKRPHEEIDTEQIVELTNGYSASDISFIVKECARCSFEDSVKSGKLVKINQMMLEKTIASTKPSVTDEELLRYERTKESFAKGSKNQRTRIGYR